MRNKRARLVSTAFTRLLRDEGGNTLAMVAAGLVPLLAMVGGAVDMSRDYMVKTRLQQACDAGVLAGRKAVGNGTYGDAAKAQAARFFNANFPAGYQEGTQLSFTSSSANNGTTVDGVASVRVPNLVMFIFGMAHTDLSVTCTSALDVTNVDVTMVLDTTGSMDDPISDGLGGTTTKIAALRAAMKQFYATVKTASNGTTARARYSFVPYAQTVNVGKIVYATNPDWMDYTHSYQSREAQWRNETDTSKPPVGYTNPQTQNVDYVDNITTGPTTTVNSFSAYSSSTCASNLPANGAWTNNGTSTTTNTTEILSDGRRKTSALTNQPQRQQYTYSYSYPPGFLFYAGTCTIYRATSTGTRRYGIITYEDPVYPTKQVFTGWVYKKRKFDGVENQNLKNYLNGQTFVTQTGDNGADQSLVWAGCIEERDTINSGEVEYKNGAISPSGMKDLDIDGVPSSSEDGWRPYVPELTYFRTYTSNGNIYYNSADTSSEGLKAFASCPKPAQLLKPMTETEFASYADGLVASGGTYHDIGMLWGGRFSSSTGPFSATVNASPANGLYVGRHLIFMTDGIMQPGANQHNAYGVEVHDKRITSDGFSDQTLRHTQRFKAICESIKSKGVRVWVIAFSTALTDDLRNCASANSSFVSLNSQQLNDNFLKIAQSIGDLRIIK